jgi:hypothetical protein
LARLTGHDHVVCIGDSVLDVFSSIASRRLIRRTRFSVCSVGGATAQGIMNPNSKTDALRIFTERAIAARDWQDLVFSLGEVDCGFLIWYRAAKYGTPVEEQLHRSIENYVSFLSRVPTSPMRRVFVLSAFLPTIADGQDWGEVANARRDVTASQRDRTALTLEYNALLEAAARSNSFEFVDVTTGHLDPVTGLVDRRFLNPDPLDHHLAEGPYGELIASQLGAALRAAPRGRISSADLTPSGPSAGP